MQMVSIRASEPEVSREKKSIASTFIGVIVAVLVLQ
jgi:hypothetical protein